jgi:tetratricopeptide (TPR) repeat protein
MRECDRCDTGPSGLVSLLYVVVLTLAGAGLPFMQAGSAAYGEPAPRAASARTILLITLDGARADLAFRPTDAPEMAALAREGVALENATTPTALTFPATASLLTGLYPHHNGVQDEFRAPLAPRFETLAKRLSEAGWTTAGFPGDYLSHGRSGLTPGFDAYHVDSPGLSDSARVDSVLSAFRRGSNERRFVWAGFTFAAEHPLWERYLGSEAADSSAYLTRAHAIDLQIGRLRAGLQELGLLSQALVVVVGTHGEAVPGWRLPTDPAGETPLPGHGLDLSEEALRVPWVMRLPDGFAAAKRKLTVADGWISTVDLLPTLLDIAGAPQPKGGDGVSLVSYLGGAPLAPRILFHEADSQRTLGWGPRYAARGRTAKILSYAGKTAVRPVGIVAPGGGGESEAETSKLLSAMAGEFKIARTELRSPTTPDTLFGREDEEIRLLSHVRRTATYVNPDAPALLADYAERYPQNILFEAERSLLGIAGRRELTVAKRLDTTLKARPDLVELEALYTELLLFFGRYDILIARSEGLFGHPMFEPDRLWRLGAAQAVAERPQDAAKTFADAAGIGVPPGWRWRQFRDDAPLIAALQAEIKAYPYRMDPYLRLGTCLWALGLFDQAYSQFEHGRGNAPTAAEPEYQLGHHLALEGRPKHAAGALLRAVEKDPKHLAARIELAYAQAQIGERDAALVNLQAAAATGDVDEQVHYNIACLLAQKGEKDGALRELAVAVKKGYANRALIEKDTDLDPIRDDPRFRKILAELP